MVPETNPLFEEFLFEHPEHSGQLQVVRMSNGTEQTCVSLGTAEAFMRWCLVHGHGDRAKIVRLLAELRPQVEQAFRERDKRGRERAPDPATE